MSPKPSAFAAPGMERAIIKTNGFFPLDIVYSKVRLEHLASAVRAAPIAHHETTSGKCYATEYGLGYSCIPRLRRSSRMFLDGAAAGRGGGLHYLPPFRKSRAEWTHPADYAPSQDLPGWRARRLLTQYAMNRSAIQSTGRPAGSVDPQGTDDSRRCV